MTGPRGNQSIRPRLLRRGFVLEYATLGWNIIGVVVLATTAVTARSVALGGFGLDSLIEIGASIVVIWELSDAGATRQNPGVRFHPGHSPDGIVWTALTAAVMFVLATANARTGAALDNQVLRAEGRVTFVDGIPAAAVLAGLILYSTLGWWWADR